MDNFEVVPWFEHGESGASWVIVVINAGGRSWRLHWSRRLHRFAFNTSFVGAVREAPGLVGRAFDHMREAIPC